jgi:hypothetical protein
MSESTTAGPRPAEPGAAAEDIPNLSYLNQVDKGGHLAA